MKAPPRAWLVGLLAGAALLALVFRPILEDLLIEPLVYLVRVAGLVVRSVSQQTCWMALVGGLAALAFSTIFGITAKLRRRDQQARPGQGPVEALAAVVSQTRRGRYFKWILANRLGTLARDYLRERSLEGSTVKPRLAGPGWQPPQKVQEYLEAGLEQAPIRDTRRVPLAFPPPSPLDLDPRAAIAYLEEQMEIEKREHTDSEHNN